MYKECLDACDIYRIDNDSEDIVGANVTYQCCCETKEISVEPFLPQECMMVSVPRDANNLSFEILSYNQSLGWSPIATLTKEQINNNLIEVSGPPCNQQVNSPVKPPSDGSYIAYSLELDGNTSGVVKMWVHYSQNGERKTKDTGSVTGGFTNYAYVPTEATDIDLEVKLLDFFTWKRIYRETFAENHTSCYRAYYDRSGYQVKRVDC